MRDEYDFNSLVLLKLCHECGIRIRFITGGRVEQKETDYIYLGGSDLEEE